MPQVLMPKATAIWLVENTALTFDQIANFTGIHRLEIQAIADGDTASSLMGYNPVDSGQLSREEINKGEKDAQYQLKMLTRNEPEVKKKSKGPRYTPIAKRQDKPDAIMYFLKFHPELSDNQIIKLIGTTKNTINAIKTKSHWNMANLRAQHPVDLGLCKLSVFNEITKKARDKYLAENPHLVPVEEPVAPPAPELE